MEAAEAWAEENGFMEMASDAKLHNHISIEAHKRLGYEVVDQDDTEAKLLKRL